MSDINVKSPALKDRELGTYRVVAKVTINGACCSTIDIPGLSVTGTATGFTVSGFEAELDSALDASRTGGVLIAARGVLATAEEGDLNIGDVVVSGTAGSRIITVGVDIAGGVAVNMTTDSLTGATLEFILPIKQKDF